MLDYVYEEPCEENINGWIDGIVNSYLKEETVRWEESRKDSFLYAGSREDFPNGPKPFKHYGDDNYAFNFVQQPVNMITGRQRQKRKSVNFLPVEGSDQQEADDYTELVSYANGYRGILEKYSKSCEFSCISGLNLMQPYLDFDDDPINGTLDLKVWSSTEFLVDPGFREPDMRDANFVICQQYTSKKDAIREFPKKKEIIEGLPSVGTKKDNFFFLPQTQLFCMRNSLIKSYIWYKTSRKKKMLYDEKMGILYDYNESNTDLQSAIKNTENNKFKEISITSPTWKLCVILNRVVVYSGENPLNFDDCPFIPNFWNYDPHLYGKNRDRSFVRSCRSTQFLLERRIILNHEAAEASLTAAWIQKENSIVNEEVFVNNEVGSRVLTKNDEDIDSVLKKIPMEPIPSTNIELASQLLENYPKIHGVTEVLLGTSDDSQAGVLEMLRQEAGITTLQKYFDQWDFSLKCLGSLEKIIIQKNWSPSKIQRIIGREPSLPIQFGVFSKFDTAVAEGLNTTVQKQQEFAQILQLNQAIGGALSPRSLIQASTIQHKDDHIRMMQEDQAQAAEMQKQTTMMEQTLLASKSTNMDSESILNISVAKERVEKSKTNGGLLEERLSEISKNHSTAMKNTADAVKSLLESKETYGKIATAEEEMNVNQMNENLISEDTLKRVEAEIPAQTAEASDTIDNFLKNKLNSGNIEQNQQNQQNQQMGMENEQNEQKEL